MTLHIRVIERPDGSSSVEINTDSRKQQLLSMSGLAEPLPPECAKRRWFRVDTPRFVKIGSAGEQLPVDAATWAAVHDTTTGLIWSAENVGGKRLSHAKAEASCEKLVLAGATDWQLPTRVQLLTLVDDTRHEPAIDIEFFPSTESAYYWTSTPCAWRPGSAAWCVYFYGGSVYDVDHDFECFVRAVRVASPAAGQ